MACGLKPAFVVESAAFDVEFVGILSAAMEEARATARAKIALCAVVDKGRYLAFDLHISGIDPDRNAESAG